MRPAQQVRLEVIGGHEVLERPSGVMNPAGLASKPPSVRNCRVRKGWVVPPLRRFSSIANGVHLVVVTSPTTTKSTANLPEQLASASRAPMSAA